MINGDVLYAIPSIAVVLGLFLLIVVANETGFRWAVRNRPKADEGVRTQTNAIQAAMLGLLALLLGFAFSMALQRFDSRSQAATEEANAIGTAYLRTELLPAEFRREAKQLLADYLDLRMEAVAVDGGHPDIRKRMRVRTGEFHTQLWDIAARAAAEGGQSPVLLGQFIQSVNEVIDVYGARQAALNKHVPEEVLVLLFGVFIVGSGLLGYASGLGGNRPLFATFAMAVLIAFVILLIIDLDRPRRGMIQVSPAAFIELQETVRGG